MGIKKGRSGEGEYDGFTFGTGADDVEQSSWGDFGGAKAGELKEPSIADPSRAGGEWKHVITPPSQKRAAEVEKGNGDIFDGINFDNCDGKNGENGKVLVRGEEAFSQIPIDQMSVPERVNAAMDYLELPPLPEDFEFMPGQRQKRILEQRIKQASQIHAAMDEKLREQDFDASEALFGKARKSIRGKLIVFMLALAGIGAVAYYNPRGYRDKALVAACDVVFGNDDSLGGYDENDGNKKNPVESGQVPHSGSSGGMEGADSKAKGKTVDNNKSGNSNKVQDPYFQKINQRGEQQEKLNNMGLESFIQMIEERFGRKFSKKQMYNLIQKHWQKAGFEKKYGKLDMMDVNKGHSRMMYMYLRNNLKKEDL